MTYSNSFDALAAQDAAHRAWLGQDGDTGPDDDRGGDNPLPHRNPAFRFVAVGELEIRDPEFVIDGLIEVETLSLVFGDPGCGKSFLAADIGLSVATGTAFHGRDTKQGSVFFIAGEGHNGLARRFHAWGKARGIPLSGVPLFKSERAAQFLDGASAKAVADAVAMLAETHGSPALIIIDTLARNFGAGDENNTKDMSEFIVAIDDLKARFPGCSVLIVHHSGHADKQRARGAMALKGALDCEFRVEKEGSEMRLINTKTKDAEPPKDMFFTFRQIELGGTASSAVLDATEAPERQHKLTPAQRLGQATYATAAAAHGVWEGGVFRGLHVDAWRDAFYTKHTGDTAASKRQAFHRVRADLVNAGEMIVTSDVYLIRDPAIQMAILMQRDNRDTPLKGVTCHAPSGDLSGAETEETEKAEMSRATHNGGHPMTGTARQRRFRQRRRDGLAVFQIEANAFELADALTAAGWLQEWDCDDRAAIQAALDRAIRHLVAGQ